MQKRCQTTDCEQKFRNDQILVCTQWTKIENSTLKIASFKMKKQKFFNNKSQTKFTTSDVLCRAQNRFCLLQQFLDEFLNFSSLWYRFCPLYWLTFKWKFPDQWSECKLSQPRNYCGSYPQINIKNSSWFGPIISEWKYKN